MKFYQLVEMIDEETFKPLMKFYYPTRAELRKKLFEKTYPNKKFKIIPRSR